MNFGFIKNKINSLFLNESEDFKNTNKVYGSYVELLKNSPVLKQEFYVYKTLEDTKFENKDIAKMFIEKIFQPFSSYTYSEVKNENDKLKNIIGNDVNSVDDENKKSFLESINNIILAYTKDGLLKDDVKSTFENSMNCILNTVTQPTVLEKGEDDEKNDIIDELGYDVSSEELAEKTYDIFKDEYQSELSEKQMKYVSELFDDNVDECDLFEKVKKEVIDGLVDDKESDEQMINECIAKVTKMKYKKESFHEDITNLLELI